MFYKKEGNGNWMVGATVTIPVITKNSVDTIELTENNIVEKNGWKWYDDTPQDYLDWVENQNNPDYDIEDPVLEDPIEQE